MIVETGKTVLEVSVKEKRPTFTLVAKPERIKAGRETESDNFRRKTTIISFNSGVSKIAFGRCLFSIATTPFRGVEKTYLQKRSFFSSVTFEGESLSRTCSDSRVLFFFLALEFHRQ